MPTNLMPFDPAKIVHSGSKPAGYPLIFQFAVNRCRSGRQPSPRTKARSAHSGALQLRWKRQSRNTGYPAEAANFGENQLPTSITNLQISGISVENRYNKSMRRSKTSLVSNSSANFGVGNLCYTESMQDSGGYWQRWAQSLHRLGATDLAASLLEGAGSLRIIAAQFVHASTPFFSRSEASNQWQALAAMLEDRAASQQFISLLKEEENS